jgi:hypothetical protein
LKLQMAGEIHMVSSKDSPFQSRDDWLQAS